MSAGQRLYVLAFDHRTSLQRILGTSGVDPTDAALRHAKNLMADAVLAIRARHGQGRRIGLLIDEEFGGQAASRARKGGVELIMPVERSGVHGFEPLDAALWERTLTRQPHHAKLLVRLNPDGDPQHVDAVHHRVREAADRLAERDVPMLVELLVPAEPAHLQTIDGDAIRYDAEVRPALTVREINALHAAGITPARWKLEGPEDVEAARMVVDAVSARGQAGCLVLGRGADAGRVEHWLRTAAAVAGFDGFAIGRSIWQEALVAYLTGRVDHDAFVEETARNFDRCCQLFEGVAAAGT